MFVHESHNLGEDSGISIWLDTVPEVEDVAGMTTIVAKHLHCTIERNIHPCEYERRVKISLHDKVRSHAFTRRRNPCSPVETKNLWPRFIHRFEKVVTSNPEVNSWDIGMALV